MHRPAACRRPPRFSHELCAALVWLVSSAVPDSVRAQLDLGTLHVETEPDALRELYREFLEGRPAEVSVPETDGRDDGETLRIALLGGTFIEREARHGYLETELTRRWPERDIVFRNLGWPGDNVRGEARAGFGPGEYRRSGWKPPSEGIGDYGYQRLLYQVHRARPHIAIVAYGSTVAFDGPGAVERFETGLGRLLDALEGAGIRVVLLSPPPRELYAQGMPDPRPQNERLAAVAETIGQMARDRGHVFVDVFKGLREISGQTGAQGLTENGIHLRREGYQAFARLVSDRLAGEDPSEDWRLRVAADAGSAQSTDNAVGEIRKSDYGLRFTVHDERLPRAATSTARSVQFRGLTEGSWALDINGQRVARGSSAAWADGIALEHGPDVDQVEALRAAIVEKNRLFFYEIRPQNEAYIYLFRRHERGHHEGELAQFATLLAEREETIARLRRPRTRHYELVRETDYPDHEVPGQRPVPDIARELERFDVAEELEVNLFAADPMVANPIGMHWDERGRLWVATSTIYPHLAPGQKPDDRILILEDIDEDGRADKSTIFADGLLVPQSVIPGHGGVWVTQSTDLLFLADTDGDDRADVRRLIFTGFGNADVHHMIHGLRWGPGGDLYFTQSIYINSWVETPWGVRQLNGSGIWRLRPELLRLDVHSRGLVNPWGHAFDRWGQSFSTDGAGGGGPSYTFAGSAHKTAKGAARTLNSMNPGRPKECGLEIVSGRHLPESWDGQLITSDFRANRVVRYELSENGSGYSSKLHGDVLASSHRSFRPVNVKQGPDGAIYVADWYSPIIDHGEVDFHHPLRDVAHGRIWRLTAKGRDLVPRARLATASIRELLDALRLPEAPARDHARRLLREKGAAVVAPLLRTWLTEFDAADATLDPVRLEALWVLQGLRTPDAALLGSLLASRDGRMRAAAVRVLGDWADRIPAVREHFEKAVGDPHPRVRLEAVTALRDARLDEAEGIDAATRADLAMRALDRPLDSSLEFAVWSAARELEPAWQPILAAGRPVFEGKAHRLAFALGAVGKEASIGPIVALLQTGELSDRERTQAMELIATLGGPAELSMVLDRAIADALSSPAAAASLLDGLADSARRGRPAPPKPERLLPLLDAPSENLVAAALRLAGNWKLDAAVPRLAALAVDPSRRRALRYDACRALLETGAGQKALRSGLQSTSADAASADELRIPMVAALARLDLREAAPAARHLLASARRAAPVELLFEAFIERQDGPATLAASLKDVRLEPEVAAAGVRIAGSTGRDLSSFIDTLSHAGSLQPLTKMPPAEELAALLRAISEKGDPARGEEIYRRDGLRCMACHALGGAGGRVGPDLSSLGGSAELVQILESVLAPSAKIKEGYEPVTVVDTTGTIHSGIVVGNTPTGLEIRDVKDRLVTLSEDQIANVTSPEISVMPEGLAQSLRRDELVDLVKFLSVLGRPGEYSLPSARYVRAWRRIDAKTNAAEKRRLDDLPSTRVYSRLDGSLPIDKETRRLEFELDLERPARLSVELEGAPSVGLMVDGKPIRLSGKSSPPIPPGRRNCSVLLAPGTSSLHIEVIDP